MIESRMSLTFGDVFDVEIMYTQFNSFAEDGTTMKIASLCKS